MNSWMPLTCFFIPVDTHYFWCISWAYDRILHILALSNDPKIWSSVISCVMVEVIDHHICFSIHDVSMQIKAFPVYSCDDVAASTPPVSNKDSHTDQCWVVGEQLCTHARIGYTFSRSTLSNRFSGFPSHSSAYLLATAGVMLLYPSSVGHSPAIAG